MIVEIMNINADKTNTANASIISMINTLNIIPNVSDIISDNFFIIILLLVSLNFV